MIIITVIEKSNGLLFNHRRVSKDRVLRNRILEIVKEAEPSRLLMDEYSSRQFTEGLPDNVVISDDFLDIAGDDDFAFVEDKNILPYADKIATIILFRWNRDYPSDFKLDLIPSEDTGFTLSTTEDFAGSSHERITEEVWERSGSMPDNECDSNSSVTTER